MKIVESGTKGFERELKKIKNRGDYSNDSIEDTVRTIIKKVKKEGDRAVIRFTKKFDGIDLSPDGYAIERKDIIKGAKKASSGLVSDLKFAANRIRKFHKNQLEKSWKVSEPGITLGQIITPIAKVGIYAPGGKATYPSSVLMNAIPAQVAGVEKIFLATPTPNGKISPTILAAAEIAGVDKIFPIGGAQSIAAMAYGTKTVEKVDKIVGPGNVYVAEAKRQLYGVVGIDMVAGPSEILILADKDSRVDFIAADLISQAEHDENAYPMLVTDSIELAKEVKKELARQANRQARGEMIIRSIKNNCIAFIVKDMKEGVELANIVASEHLEIMTKNPNRELKGIVNAGAVFVGSYTPEAVGDYAAGPNHVLPTGGSARFFSPLGVYDFLKRTSLISFNKESLAKVGRQVISIAEDEGLSGHAEAVRKRL
ncbi:MAG: histidinol dehydrogenase [Nitrospinota bacterium]|nr:histidinol dehydrogenase [Nitrospinota bacterium]